MKKIKLFILSLIIMFVSCINVNADDTTLYSVGSELNSGNGYTHTYENYSYNSAQIYRQGNELYFSGNITNNKKQPQSISVEALLFNSEKKNIGVFNYCSAKDYETEFANYKIQPNTAVSFKYKITNLYLANSEEDSLNDIAYFAIISDNEYCKVGGYDNYYGKTLEDIVDVKTTVSTNTKFDAIVSKINRFIPIEKLDLKAGVGIVIAIVVLIIVIAIWVAFGAFLNKLHNAMYSKTTALAYVPIANMYLCVKMAFGKIIGLSYLGVTLLGGLITLVGFGFVSTIANLALFVAFILDIVKLVTGKYELCYLDKANSVIIDNINNNQNNDNSNNNNQEFVQTMNQTNEYGYSQDSNVKESLLGVDTNNSIEEDNSPSVDTGGIQNNNNDNNQDNNNSDESDLSRFFR